MLVKNKKTKIEYGTYGNFVNVIPKEIIKKDNDYTCIKCEFSNGIFQDVCTRNNNVDFNSFN